MVTVRPLLPQEYNAWDDLVATSPQAGLTHTSAWNQMFCETDTQKRAWVPLVCEQKGHFLGGISCHTTLINKKKHANLPTIGYNGPFLAPQQPYAQKHQTIPAYNLIKQLLNQVNSLTDFAVVYNQPEIWDMRPYRFQGWQMETAYTHLSYITDPDRMWKKFHPQVQTQIVAVQNSFILNHDATSASIKNYCKQVSQLSRQRGEDQVIQAETLEKRIEWMLARDVCRLVSLTGQGGKEIGSSLFILSRSNRTIYIWKTVWKDKNLEPTLFPFLVWQSSLNLCKDFSRIDLGKAANPAISQINDQMGSDLTPIFTTRFYKK